MESRALTFSPIMLPPAPEWSRLPGIVFRETGQAPHIIQITELPP